MRGERGVGEGELDIVMDKVRETYIAVTLLIVGIVGIIVVIFIFIFD